MLFVGLSTSVQMITNLKPTDFAPVLILFFIAFRPKITPNFSQMFTPVYKLQPFKKKYRPF